MHECWSIADAYSRELNLLYLFGITWPDVTPRSLDRNLRINLSVYWQGTGRPEPVRYYTYSRRPTVLS
jgi:hypothetical protein